MRAAIKDWEKVAERRERRLLWDREKVKGENFYNVVVVGVAVCCVAEEEEEYVRVGTVY